MGEEVSGESECGGCLGRTADQSPSVYGGAMARSQWRMIGRNL